ncbi:hypothetical protein GCM10010363_72960 [Streptomyces omiyaensis]|nr:hypothetical protein GCM10010363_72960 [Streptomyces omiyaensis]
MGPPAVLDGAPPLNGPVAQGHPSGTRAVSRLNTSVCVRVPPSGSTEAPSDALESRALRQASSAEGAASVAPV